MTESEHSIGIEYPEQAAHLKDIFHHLALDFDVLSQGANAYWSDYKNYFRDGMIALTKGDSSWMNTLYMTSAQGENALHAFSNILSQKGLPGTVFIPHQLQTTFRAVLENLHFAYEETDAIMVRKTDPQAKLPTRDILVVEEVATRHPKALTQFAKVHEKIFEIPAQSTVDSLSMIDPRLKLYIGRDAQTRRVRSVMSAVVHPDGKAGIHGVATLKTQQGKGYAKELMSQVMNQLTQQGVQECYLAAMTEGLRLYQGLGFSQIGAEDLYTRNV